MNIPRPEYPRPSFVRPEWINLNGEWEFEIDTGRSGRERGMMNKDHLDMRITVPFCPESRLSGLAHTDFMEAVWYKKVVTLPEGWQAEGRRTILHIGACDYDTEVWVNGVSVGKHIGAYISFKFDITSALKEGENAIVITATDLLRRNAQPGGKQSKRYGSYGCFYTRTTGIWQTVWLENVPGTYIINTKCTPSLADQCLYIDAKCANAHGKTVTATALYNGKEVGRATGKVVQAHAIFTLNLSELHLWDVFKPELYDLILELEDDRVESYFGMREVAVNDEKIYLNGRVVFQRLILDQGFYPDGIITAPSDDALIFDIKASMSCGFNGARLHQKVFEPRFLYHADRLGYMVWDETGNWGFDHTKAENLADALPEWLEEVERDFSHPSIIGWCPFNETWDRPDGSRQCDALLDAYYLVTKSIDTTRPVVTSSGSYPTNYTDIHDVHDYEQDPEKFRYNYSEIDQGIVRDQLLRMNPKRQISKTHLPIFVSEYGGIKWVMGEDSKAWGYGASVTTEEEFFTRLEGLTDVLLENKDIFAYCYTQLTDVEQEQNGLLTYDRQFKFAPEKYARIFGKKAVIED